MSTGRPIRVTLADDHVMVREALSQILEASESIEVVGQADDGAAALALIRETLPDVAVCDYSMPALDTLSILEWVVKQAPSTKVIVLTVHENLHYAVKVLEAGAHGFVVKSGAVQELVDAIRAVREGDVYISPKVSQKVLQHLRTPKKSRGGLDDLSQREFELLRALGAGSSLKECARRLKITTSTASTYRARLMEKLELNTTAEIIRYAIENDIVG